MRKTELNLLAVVIIAACAGCADGLAARGHFVGEVVRYDMYDGEKIVPTLGLITRKVPNYSTWRNPDLGRSPSAGRLSFLCKDSNGNILKYDPKLVGKLIEFQGVMKTRLPFIDGREAGWVPGTPNTLSGIEVKGQIRSVDSFSTTKQ